MSAVTPYPLQWPQGFPRYSGVREGGSFRTDFDRALANVRKSLQLFANDSGKTINYPVLSSNVNPLALVQSKVTDPGVAVWFVFNGIPVCIAVDRYCTPA